MRTNSKYIVLNLVTAFAVTLFFSCNDASSDLQRFNQRNEGPAAEGEGVVLRYTDSGKVVATLKTPYILDYSIAPFPYEEFPQGVEVIFIDDDGKENYITSKYAIRYRKTNLIDLRDSVVMILSDSTKLNAEQLYWDQNNDWVFTDMPYTIRFPDDKSYNSGSIFDSSEDFKNFVSLNNESRMFVKETDSLTTQQDSLQ